MEKDLYLKTTKLKQTLEDDPRVIRLNELEKKMNESEEVMLLAYQKDLKADEYSDALKHFSSDSEEVSVALKNLHEAKLKLDNHPLVKEYLSSYKEVKELYNQINEILFANFESNLCPKEK